MDIAKYIVNKCVEDNRPISNLQLQKILYYVQINFIRLLDRVAFDEDIEAWKYGPVVPSVYYEFSDCGGTVIYRTFKNAYSIFSLDSDRRIVDRVIELCLKITPWELVDKTHKQGTPWDKAYQQNFRIIPSKYLFEYAKTSR